MANELSVVISNELANIKNALPEGFNCDRYVQNAIAALNGNDTLIKFCRNNGTGQFVAALKRGAIEGLDISHAELYLIPFGDTLSYMPSYKGMKKMAKKYSQRPVLDIYAKIVREGDEFEEIIDHGHPSINFKSHDPFGRKPLIGVFAVAEFKDGGILYEVMSVDEINACKNQSRQKNSMPWAKFYNEMAKKCVVRRLCKGLDLDMDIDTQSFFESGTEIITDPKEQAEKDVSENTGTEELVIDSNLVTETTNDEIENIDDIIDNGDS
jgi:recombination protein RecT